MSRYSQTRRKFLQTVACTAGGLQLGAAPRAASSQADVDVLVLDSTPGGIIAAIAAAQCGGRVLLVTEDKHIGGMQSSGLGNTNAGQRTTVGGLASEFYQRIQEYYLKEYGAGSEQLTACDSGFHFEPHVAEQVYLQWMAEAGVQCWTEDWIVSLDKSGPRIEAARLQSGRIVRAKIYVDASYEGDLFQMAGCSYHLGRESSQKYGESLAGVRFPPHKVGQPDRKVQAYDYRLCLTDVPQKQVSFPEPRHYDRELYSYYSIKLTADPPQTLHEALPMNFMPNRKTDSRTGEWVGGSWGYPEAGGEERKRIARAHQDYSAGYIWFLLHDAPISDAIRDELSGWGLAKDEFVDNDNWPYHLYVREARRLVGDYVMTQRDVTEQRFQRDAVALGSFFLDVHPVQIVGGVVPEGGIRTLVRPYEIPYRALLPRRTECQNLLVPVCVSSSHVAYSTLRMEPVYQMLGHAAGVATMLSLQQGVALHSLAAEKLKERLLQQGQILDARPFKDRWPQSRAAMQRPSLEIRDENLESSRVS